ncbi:hypothetical protein M3Y99_01668400 [Aphelenchoides fujianensis]|nr:hypothetical protein M3Y99_01668400 [Aphelenchoides fujianensis]
MVARITACNGAADEHAEDAVVQLAQELVDTSHPIHIESLLDALVAIFHDCNLPILKRIRSVEMFLAKYEPIVNRLINCRMNVQDFSIIKVIGRGAFGDVQLVRHKRSKRVFAMKRLDKAEVIRRYEVSFFWEERDIMAHSNSEWIVQMYYSFQDFRYLYMVMEFMPGGDLVNLMSREEFPEEWARFYVAELVLALDALHGLGYIHRGREDQFPTDVEVSANAKDIIKRFLSHANTRLGVNGAPEVMAHPFFRNDQWTFETIRTAEPPFTPRLSTDDDTSNFEDVTPAAQNGAENFQIPKAFQRRQPVVHRLHLRQRVQPLLSSLRLENGPANGIKSLQPNGKPKHGDAPESRPRNDEELRNMRAQLAHLELKNAEKDQLVEAKAAEVQTAQSEVAQLKQKLAEEKSLYDKKVIQTNTNLAELRLKCEELTAKVQSEKQEKGGRVVSSIHSLALLLQNSTKAYYDERHASQQALLESKDAQITQLKAELETQSALLHRERQEQAQRLHCEQKQSEEIDTLRQQENSSRNQIWALKEQKTKLESAVQSLQSDRNRLETRLNTLKEEHSTAQKLAEVYKTELDETRTEISEMGRKLEDAMHVPFLSAEDQLHTEQIARRISDQNVTELEHENRYKTGELSSFMHRLEQAEALNKQLQEALNKARDDVRMGPPRSNTGPVIHHQADRSSDSLSNSVSTTSLNDLEGLNREQLIQRCKREALMKQSLVEKLAVLGSAKGIETEHRGGGGGRAGFEDRRQEASRRTEPNARDKEAAQAKQEIELLRVNLQDAINKNSALKHEQHEMERQLNLFRKELPPELVRHVASGMMTDHSKKKRVFR